LITVDLSTLTSVNNNPKLVFRIKFRTRVTGTSGNNRFDNVTVEGDTMGVTGISTVSINNGIYNLYPNPANDNIVITGLQQGSKTISITDMLGQTVYFSESTENNVPVNTAQLSKGLYYVHINEVANGISSMLKFVKE
jgi:hypothetical protein